MGAQTLSEQKALLLSESDDELYTVDSIKLSKDLKKAAKLLTSGNVRYLVDRYYQLQNDRIRAKNIDRKSQEDQEPNELIEFTANHAFKLERTIKSALGVYVANLPVGGWLLANHGIGPVIASGLVAHIDIHRANTAGKIWRFAGLDPTSVWNKKQKRPWNARLKVLCWKAGESFVKFHKNDKCFYGHIWRERKDKEIARNESGGFRSEAQAILDSKKFGKETEVYKAALEGKLSKGHLHNRARRYTVKLFLSHLQQVWWTMEFRQPPPAPYAMVHLGHVDYIPPPNWEQENHPV